MERKWYLYNNIGADMIREKTLEEIKQVGLALDYVGYSSQTKQDSLEIDAGDGQGFIFGLYKSPEYSICRNFCSSNSTWPRHYHNEWEQFVVVRGEMHLTVGGEKIIVKAKESYYIEPNVEHEGYFPVDTWFTAMSIPGTEAYPDA